MYFSGFGSINIRVDFLMSMHFAENLNQDSLKFKK